MEENVLGGDIAGAITKLKEHPEIITAVASALSGSTEVKSEVAGAAAPSSQFPIEKLSEVMTTLAPMLSGASPAPKEISGSREDHRHALLCALRPYMRAERREVIDYLLKFERIGDLLKKIK